MITEAVEITLRPVRVTPIGSLDGTPPLGSDDTRVGGKSSGSRPPNTNDQPSASAMVVVPVAAAKSANSSLVTGCAAMTNASVRASRTGPS